MSMGLGLGLGIANRVSGGYGNDFVFTVETTAPNETFTIPCQNIGVFNAIMDHGDGAISHITAYNDADLAHTYAVAGIHTIRVRGSFPNIYFNNGGDKAKVRSVIQLGKVGWATLYLSFYGCSGMTSFAVGVCDTSQVDTMFGLLWNCASLVSADFVGANTSNVSVMGYMFYGCSNLISIDLSGIDTALVINMLYMCRFCSKLEYINISGWSTSLVLTMVGMFQGCSMLNSDLSDLDFDSVTDLTNFIYNCDSMSSANLDLLLASIYAQRASISWETPALDISSLTNNPTGVYQDATPPTTGLEYVYKLVNDPDVEGFNVWTITY